MPEYIILQCFSCKIFQVQIIKQSSKWTCKLCNFKQSIIKIFMKNETAKECRVAVQEMNEKYIKYGEKLATELLLENICLPKEPQTKKINEDDLTGNLKHIDSKWSKYVEVVLPEEITFKNEEKANDTTSNY